MSVLCTDNRFELIEKYKQKLIECTNIESAPDEMAVLDNILFRIWQMGWLDKLDLPSAQPEQNTGKWIEKEIYETRQKEEMQVAKCSNCKKYLTTPYIYSFNHYNYCPNCGVEMGNTD